MMSLALNKRSAFLAILLAALMSSCGKSSLIPDKVLTQACGGEVIECKMGDELVSGGGFGVRGKPVYTVRITYRKKREKPIKWDMQTGLPWPQETEAARATEDFEFTQNEFGEWAVRKRNSTFAWLDPEQKPDPNAPQVTGSFDDIFYSAARKADLKLLERLLLESQEHDKKTGRVSYETEVRTNWVTRVKAVQAQAKEEQDREAALQRELERQAEIAHRTQQEQMAKIEAEYEKMARNQNIQNEVGVALEFLMTSLGNHGGHTLDEFMKMRDWENPNQIQQAISQGIEEAENRYAAQYPDNPNARNEFRKMRAEDKVRRYRKAHDDPEFVKMIQGKPFTDGWRAFSFWMPLEYAARRSADKKSPVETIPKAVNLIEKSVSSKSVAEDSAPVQSSVIKTTLVEKQQSYDSSDWSWGDILRVAEDPDGHTNVRAGQSTTSKIVANLASGSVVAIDPQSKGGWSRLISGRDTGDEKFYIHSSRLREITGWTHHVFESLKPNATSAGIKLSDVEVSIQSKPFDSTVHKVHKAPDGTFLVDDIKPWGVDGGLPISGFTLSVSFEGKSIRLPDSAFSDLFEANEDTLSVIRNPGDKSHFLVVMTNGDAAGAYYVVWAIKGGQYVGRAVIEGYAPEIN